VTSWETLSRRWLRRPTSRPRPSSESDSIKDSALGKKDEFVSRAKEATPDSASSGAQHAVTAIKRDPVPFTGIAVFAAGLLVGWLIGRR